MAAIFSFPAAVLPSCSTMLIRLVVNPWACVALTSSAADCFSKLALVSSMDFKTPAFESLTVSVFSWTSLSASAARAAFSLWAKKAMATAPMPMATGPATGAIDASDAPNPAVEVPAAALAVPAAVVFVANPPSLAMRPSLPSCFVMAPSPVDTSPTPLISGPVAATTAPICTTAFFCSSVRLPNHLTTPLTLSITSSRTGSISPPNSMATLTAWFHRIFSLDAVVSYRAAASFCRAVLLAKASSDTDIVLLSRSPLLDRLKIAFLRRTSLIPISSSVAMAD